MASRVNRAATSETLSAPRVITINCMITKIRKIINPTTVLPPTTKEPKVAITSPAWALRRIRRVEEILRARRNIVIISSNDGKTENSKGSTLNMDTMRITRAKEILKVSKISSSQVGIGIIIIMTILTTSTATSISLRSAMNLIQLNLGSMQSLL